MKFLPATFAYDKSNSKLSVHGYIQVFYNGRNGTVRDRAVWEDKESFTDGIAKVFCKTAGYADTDDGWKNGKFQEDKSVDRSLLYCLLSGLRCYGTESDISICTMDPEPPTTTASPTTTTVATTKGTTTTTTKGTTTKATTTGTTPPHKNSVHDDYFMPAWDHKQDVAIKCDF